MNFLLGIDLGTSNVKGIITDENGKIYAGYSENYPIYTPKLGYAEQKPEEWWASTIKVIRKLLVKTEIKPSNIRCIGVSGQMHGMVVIDKEKKNIRPAIIWCDQRSKEQASKIYKIIGSDRVHKTTLNKLFPGFQLASLFWLKDKELSNYKKIYKVILPKDYLRLKLTGKIQTDYTDASGTGAFNIKEKKWANDLISCLGIETNIFPEYYDSFEIGGYITKSVEKVTGLKEGIPVIVGCGDQPAQLLGNGIINAGSVSISVGTGGQIVSPIDKPFYDFNFRTHTFCNVKLWYIMGAILSAGLALQWLSRSILKINNYDTLDEMAAEVPVGSEGLFFLPYLIGERTPYMNTNAKGIFCGLTLRHNQKHLVRAVMEGVSFALKDCVEVLEESKIEIKKIIFTGGGAKSKLWVNIIKDVLGRDILINKYIEGPSLGAAILAGLGSKIFTNIESAVKNFVKEDFIVIKPNKKNQIKYKQAHYIFKELYKNNKDLFNKINI